MDSLLANDAFKKQYKYLGAGSEDDVLLMKVFLIVEEV